MGKKTLSFKGAYLLGILISCESCEQRVFFKRFCVFVMALNFKNTHIIKPLKSALSFGRAILFTRAEVWAKEMG